MEKNTKVKEKTFNPISCLLIFYFFFITILVPFCIKVWKTDTDVKQYTVAEIEKIIDENYIKQKEKAYILSDTCIQTMRKQLDAMKKLEENNYEDSITRAYIQSLQEEIESGKCWYDGFSREDTIVIFDNKRFEMFATGISIAIILLLLIYGYVLFIVVKENWNE